MTLRIGAISYRYINDFSLFCVKLDPHNFYSFSSSSFSPIFFILARSNVERKTQRVLQRRPRGRVADFTRIRTGDDRREVYTRTVYLFIYFFFSFLFSPTLTLQEFNYIFQDRLQVNWRTRTAFIAE